MDRPRASKKRTKQWSDDDQRLSEHLDQLRNEVFNLDRWEFFVESKQEYLSYPQIVSLIKDKRFLQPDLVQALRESFLNLPSRFNHINDRLFTIWERVILSVEEKTSYIDELESYADTVDARNTELEEALAEYERVEHVSTERIDELEQAVSSIRESIEQEASKDVEEKAPVAKKKPEDDLTKKYG